MAKDHGSSVKDDAPAPICLRAGFLQLPRPASASVRAAHPLSVAIVLRLSFLSSTICSAKIRASSWAISSSRVSLRAFRKRLAR